MASKSIPYKNSESLTIEIPTDSHNTAVEIALNTCKHEYKTAFALFDHVLEQNEDSPRAHFGKARAYEIKSDSEADGELIDLAINEYQAVLKNEDSPDALYNQAASRLIERARFRGLLHTVLMAQRALIDRFPDDPELQNDFALTFLMMGREDDAFKVYNDVLKLYPENGMAQAYYGFIQKLRGNFDEAVLFMRKGFRGTQRKITDPRFYYHFGDALMRLGKTQEAYEVYSEGAKIGLFLSPYQRSLHNFRGLSAKPWWTIEQTTYGKFLKVLEKQWTVIREEAIILLKTHPEYFTSENSELTLFGNWSAFYFYRGWSWDESNCMKARKTCELLKEFRDTSNSSKSEMKLSLLTSNSRVWPHCGYSNCRLQAHMGLVVPSEARIRVADEIRGWKTGRFIIFDDSFEHELWFEGASANKYCLVLSIDLWHPDVASERRIDLGSL
uniref:TPR_REGION domain-containing protein n=1 Tax=Syphacia muris TaxID=451379 RepID=A0A0N5ASR8_9BILA